MFYFDEEKKEDPGTWFPFQDSHLDVKAAKYVFDKPGPKAPRFRFRSPTPFYIDRRKKRQRAHEFALNPKTMAMERVAYFKDLTAEEEQQESDDMRDYVLTGIEGAVWESKKEIACTRENKLKLFLNDNFNRFAGRCIAMLSGIETDAEERSEKN